MSASAPDGGQPADVASRQGSAGPSSRPPPRIEPRIDWRRRWHRSEALRRRLAAGAALGSCGGLLLGLVDTRWARGDGAAAPGLWRVWSAEAGLVCPLGLAIGLGVALGGCLVQPRGEPGIGALAARLRAAGAGRPADVAAFAPLAVLGLFVWATLSAQLGRLLLGAELGAAACGGVIAAASILLALLVGASLLAFTPALRLRLATWRVRWRLWVDPVVTASLALFVVVLLGGYGVARGTVSGEGGLLGIWGVLKRQELDLRAPLGLLLLGGGTLLAAPLLSAVRPHRAWLVALLPLTLTVRAAVALERDPDLARLIERDAPVARRPLRWLRSLNDRDGDGAGRWFGGGDCNDSDPAIGPAADDIPDNGIDEDCSGADLSLTAIETTSRPPAGPDPSAAARARIARDGNLVLITIDSLRYDLGYSGYGRPISPALDKLVGRSVLFERAYALASYTGKSVGPMLVGKLGSETHRNWGHFNVFSAEDRMVAERIKPAGIRTLSVQAHRYFGSFSGLDRGFDVVDLSSAPPEGVAWATDATASSDRLTDAAIRLLTGLAPAGRFFLWVHYQDPHADYLRHEGVPVFGSGPRDLYDGEVAFVDRHVGRLLDHIAAASWSARTSIIVTSDHGEAFGEHKMYRHGFELWEPLVRVPLIVHVPGIAPQRIAARRSLLDLVPTILDLLGLDPAPRRAEASPGASDFVSGESLLGDLLLRPGTERPARDIMIDMPAGPYNEARRAFIHGDLKLVISRDAHKELFDLASDPEESRSLWPGRRDEIEARYALAKRELRLIEVEGARK